MYGESVSVFSVAVKYLVPYHNCISEQDLHALSKKEATSVRVA